MIPEQINVPGVIAKPLSCAVTVHGNQVVQHFSEPREFVAFSGIEPVVIGARMLACSMEADDANAEHVIKLAMGLMDAAYELRGDLKPAGGAVKHELIERHRVTLTTRLRLVLNSRRDRKKISNDQLAREMTDILLHEVFG